MIVEVRDTIDKAACIARLQAVEQYATDAAQVADIIDGCALLDIVEGGQVVGAAAVEVAGQAATIKAVVADMAEPMAAYEVLCGMLRRAGVRHVAFFTRRPGLVRRMLARGYRLVEAELETEV